MVLLKTISLANESLKMDTLYIIWLYLILIIYILIINHYCDTYNTSDAVFPIGIRSQSSCAILFIWKRNKRDITIILTYSAMVIWSVTCVCENRLGHLGSIHQKAWIFLFISETKLALGPTQPPIQWRYFSRHISTTALTDR